MSRMEVSATQKNEVEATSDDSLNLEQPTAFILKLFEMINGAPDEVIAWTPEGDAFIIGANLKTLESETLPRFFRHSRFQSFVRQLNFYSFRKINRERTMWVYKHDLFHRDRPEDLALLRRRTCPTIDGRRQSLTRPILKKPSSSNQVTRSSNESPDVKVRALNTNHDKKRQMASLFPQKSFEPAAKRPSLVDGRNLMTVDTVSPIPLTESEDSDDQGVTDSISESRNSKTEDQAMIVLKIASQLAQHVRNPKNGSRISGLVTPTYGASRNGSMSSGTLLTYDDEGEKMNHNYDDSQESRYDFTTTKNGDSNDLIQRSNSVGKTFGKRTPLSKSAADETVDRLFEVLDSDARLTMQSTAKVARFCMMTLPGCCDVNGGNPIRSFLSSCKELSAEFNLYRSALSPLTAPMIQINDYESHQRMWMHDESRLETARTFSVFAVNHMQSLLRAILDNTISYRIERNTEIVRLERTISIWQKCGYDTM